MASPANGAIQQQSLFTVEQIELIRRLRNSGINKEQMAQAFDCLDRLDRELGPVYSVPMSQALIQQAFQRMPIFAAPVIQTPIRSPITPTPPQLPTPVQPQIPLTTVATQPTPVTTPVTTPPVSAIRKRPFEGTEGMIFPDTPNSDLPNGIGDLDEQEEKEFVEFVIKGEAHCCEEIRNFVIQYSIKQQQVATLSGISQSYVSRYLKGDYYDMSERSRRAIQKWFIVYRKNAAAIGPAVNTILLSCGPSPKKLISCIDPSNEFTSYPKRERFVFRPNHIEILEKFFQEDSYPTYEKREEIARTCNTTTEAMAGRELVDKEKVTVQVVSNWFANKRKEMKKIAREEGLDPSQTSLRHRGRPPRMLADIINQLAQQNHMSLQNEPGTPHMIIPDGTIPVTLATPASMAMSHDHLHPHQTGLDSLPTSHHSGLENLDRSQQTGLDGLDIKHQVNIDGLNRSQQANLDNLTDSQQDPFTNSVSPPGSHHEVPVSHHEVPVSHHEVMSLSPETMVSQHNGVFGGAAHNGVVSVVQPAMAQEASDEQSLQLSVELAAVNQAILSLTGQQPINIKVEKMEADRASSSNEEHMSS